MRRSRLLLTLALTVAVTACKGADDEPIAPASEPIAALDSDVPEESPARPPDPLPRPPPRPDADPSQTPDAGGGPDAGTPPLAGRNDRLLRTEPSPVSEALLERIRESRRENLPIDHLISRGEVRELTGYLDALAPTVLEGQAPTESYNAMRLAAEESFGLGLQVWTFGNTNQAAAHFDRMRETHIVTGSTRVSGDNGFRAGLGDINQLVFLVRRHNAVVALSCDQTVCPDTAVLQEMALRVHSRF